MYSPHPSPPGLRRGPVMYVRRLAARAEGMVPGASGGGTLSSRTLRRDTKNPGREEEEDCEGRMLCIDRETVLSRMATDCPRTSQTNLHMKIRVCSTLARLVVKEEKKENPDPIHHTQTIQTRNTQ